MEEDTIDRIKYAFPAHSALFHCVDGLIFTRHGFAHKTVKILSDENDRNQKIRNEKRLKDKLFREIMYNYNRRIDRYTLLLIKFSSSKKDDLEIIKYKLVSSMGEEEGDYSGRYAVYPRSFVCSKCGDFRVVSIDEWSIFNPNKCRIQGCDGRYEQISILMFCEKCGKIVPLYYPCKKHGTRHIRLIRKEKDSLLTWRVVCQKCYEEGSKEPIDIFRFTCNHLDKNNKKICNEKATKFKPLTIKEGGVFTPVVMTCVDIPPTENIQLEDLEYLLLGLYLDKFNEISGEIKSNVNLSKIESFVRTYKDQNIKDTMFSTDPTLSKLPLDMREREWKKRWFIDVIESVTKNLKDNYSSVDLENLNDYFAIKGVFSDEDTNIMSYDGYLDLINDGTRKKMLKESYNALKQKFGIGNITYISDINLVSSCIGVINGINKFYEPGFVPHFNPIWKDKRKKDKFVVYSYPFETEGLLIDLDKLQICNWLIDNGFLLEEKPKKEEEAIEILLKIEKDTESYNALKTLLHTLSHTLIRRSSLYTGLDSDSCGELIFVNPGALLIYSTSNINIGGFEYVFEHSLKDWFNEVEYDIRDCTFDPTCIFENGACFSCLYLPEYVCSEFNHYLDRDVFIGTKRYKVSYW